MTAVRAALLVGGTAAAAVGTWELLRSGLSNIVATVWWLAGGVVAHDALLAPVTLLVVFAASRRLPEWLRAPAAVGFVVLGSVTVVAIPVLGRFGARSDNPTLLDRNYLLGWLVVAAVVTVGVGLAARLRRSRGSAGLRHGSRRPPI
jgi:hypothetical protein